MIHQGIKIHIYGWLFASALLAAGCGQEEEVIPTVDPVETTGKVIIDFTVASELNTSTRTIMNGEDMHHVQAVQLYIFNGTEGTSTCVASENVNWVTTANGATETRSYEVQYNGFVPGDEYTFLAVGTDDVSPTTYGFPGAITTGTLLSAANATLASGQTAVAIRTSELYAGAAVLTPADNGNVHGNVDLWRRVAGVMGCFTNVPTEWEAKTVASIEIRFSTNQNTSVPLIKQETDDFITSPGSDAGADVLVSINPLTNEAGGGSFVLPAGKPDAAIYDHTLRVVLLDDQGVEITSRRVLLSPTDDPSGTDEGTGIIDPNGAFLFPIVANCLYAIGTPNAPLDLTNVLGSPEVKAELVSDWNSTNGLDI